jgi:hypothetical protein
MEKEALTRDSTQYFLDFLVAFLTFKVNLDHHYCDFLQYEHIKTRTF